MIDMHSTAKKNPFYALSMVFLMLAMSLSQASGFLLEDENRERSTTQISQASETTYLFDTGTRHDAVNAMAYSPVGDLVVGGTFCALYELPESPEDCSISIDGVEVSSDEFASAYVLTMDSLGNTKDIQIFNSDGGDRVDSIAFADNGDMLVGGSACWLKDSSCTLTGFGISLSAVDEGGDAWIARLGPGGEAVWSLMIGSEGFDTIHSIDESPDGSIFVSGSFCQWTTLLCQISIGDQLHQSKGGADVMVVKISSDGDVLWSKSFGSGSTDTDVWGGWYSLSQKGVVATQDGGVLLSGWACEGWNANCQMTIETGYVVYNHNAYLLKYASNGTIERLTTMNGDGADFIQAMVAVDDDRVLVAGNHYSSTLYAGSLSVYNSGGSDAWYAIYNHSSHQFENLWDSKSGGNEAFHSAAVMPDGNLVLGGTQCWGNGADCPFTIETKQGAEKTRYSSINAEGFLMLHDMEWNDIAWMRGIDVNDYNESAASFLSDLAVSNTGNIAANFPVCVSDNNTGCKAGIGDSVYHSVDNGSLIYQITFDSDGDGVMDADDHCLTSPEVGWVSDQTSDLDGDGCRDSDQDDDDDGDGVGDSSDHFPLNPLEWQDTDGDGIGNNQDGDDDSDGWTDAEEAGCGGTDPLSASDTPRDTDGDGTCNHIDADDDGDDVDDVIDAFPLEICASSDRDMDGMPDQFTVPGCPTSLLADPDDDNDGVLDADDIDPLDSNVGGDSDGDGKPDWVIGDATSRYDQDQDDDNDGVMDVDDAFPLIPTESVDSDGDGIGDNTDVDDDGDGWSDYDEAQCNSDPLVRTDTPADDDSDGTCNLMESSTSFENYALTVVVLVLMIAAGMAISARMGQKSFAPSVPPSPPPLPLEGEDSD